MKTTIAIVLCTMLLFFVACGSSDDGTLNESNNNPNNNVDDDVSVDDDNNLPPPDDDDDNTDDDTTGDDDTFAGEAMSLSIDPAYVVEPRGYTIEFSATGYDENNNPLPSVSVVWSSSDDSIATIDQDGLATLKENGTVSITAVAKNDDSVTASATLIVAGDVFVLDSAAGYLGNIDISDGTVDSDYLDGALGGTPYTMAIAQDNFGFITNSEGNQGRVDVVNLLPNAKNKKDGVQLYTGHVGTNLIYLFDYLYVTEPTSDDLAILGMTIGGAYVAGLILVNDNDAPTDLAFQVPYLMVTMSCSKPKLGVYNEGYVYYFENNYYIKEVNITRENPIEMSLINSGGGAGDLAVLSTGNFDTTNARLDLITSEGQVDKKVEINADPWKMSGDGMSFIWFGDRFEPNVYVYDANSSSWLFAPSDPIELEHGTMVTAVKVVVSRNEVYIADDEGYVYRFNAVTGELLDTYKMANGYVPADIIVW